MTNHSQSFVLILGGEFPLRERVFAGALRGSGGLPVVTIAGARNSAALKFFDDVITADVMSGESVVQALEAYQTKTGRKPAAVIPMNDFVVRTGLAVAERFDLPFHSPQTVENCRDKYLMKQVLQAGGVPVPRFGRFRTYEELSNLVREFRFPVVIKPIELAGSVGVLKVENPDQLRATFDHCIQEIQNLGGIYRTREELFQVEEYVPAYSEVSIEVINSGDLHRVMAVTEKYLGAEPYFVEVGHMVPSPHTDNPRLRQIAEDACRVLGIRMGVAHVEARITPGGDIRIMEVGARTGGDAIMDLVERVYGINPYQLYVESFLGRPLSMPNVLVEYGTSAVAFLKANEGTITRVNPPKPSEMPASLVNIQIGAKPMDRSLPPTSWRSREGSVEFFWPDLKTSHGWDDHLQLAREIAARTFEVQS